MVFYKRKLFWVLFGIPNILSILYFDLIATPQYVSQSSLVVYQSASADNSPVTLELGQNGGMSVEGDYLVQSFITSWRCFESQDRERLQKSWSDGDILTRFGGLSTLFYATVTDLYQYYQGHVYTHIDQSSAIMTVSVRGYDPVFVQYLNQKILDASDKAVNDMNQQAYQNAENFFQGRVEDAKEQLKAVILSMTGIQKNNNVLDPSSAYKSQLDLINNLTVDKVALEAQLSVIQKATPNSEQIQGLEAEISEISNQIASMSGKINGSAGALTSADGDFSYNQALIQNAESNLLNVETQLLTAQQTALQHEYFMEYIDQPSVPPNPTEPKRLEWVLGMMFATFLFYLIVKPNN